MLTDQPTVRERNGQKNLKDIISGTLLEHKGILKALYVCLYVQFIYIKISYDIHRCGKKNISKHSVLCGFLCVYF